jgi:hypothetical protein
MWTWISCSFQLFAGPVVEGFNLAPLLKKRLRVQGSTLRSRSAEYQTNLIAKSFRPICTYHFADKLVLPSSRFKKEILCHITDQDGDGPIKVYVHKVRIYFFIEGKS